MAAVEPQLPSKLPSPVIANPRSGCGNPYPPSKLPSRRSDYLPLGEGGIHRPPQADDG